MTRAHLESGPHVCVCARSQCRVAHARLLLAVAKQGLTEAQLDGEVWPADTYASLLLLLPVGIAAERWSYRGVIIVGLLCRQATRALLVFGSGLWAMQLMQVCYACATNVEAVVYFAYPYCVLGHPAHFITATVRRALSSAFKPCPRPVGPEETRL